MSSATLTYAGTAGIPMPSSTASSMVIARAMNWNTTDPPDPSSRLWSHCSTSSEMKNGSPVNFRQKSMIETARNIRYRVEIRIPASENASSSRRGRARMSGSRNSRKHSRNTAHQPALPASPAAFWSSWSGQESRTTSHPPAANTRSAPSRPSNQPQPTFSLDVSNRKRMTRIGPKIITRL